MTKVCVIGTDVNPVPTEVAWSGIESLVTYQVKGFVELGLDVTLVSMKGSKWKDWDKIKLVEIDIPRDCDREKVFFEGYRNVIQNFDGAVIDHSNGKLAWSANNRTINVTHWLQYPGSMAFKNVVCISRCHADWARSCYPRNIASSGRGPEIVYNGMDPSTFPFVDRDGKGDENLFFSVLGPYKGADTVIELAHRLPQYKFAFGGRNSDYSDVVKREAAEHKNIIFYGEVSHDKKKEIMGRARVLFQLPKRFNPQDRYPFMDILPMTIIEANLCGTPIIGLNEGGVPEMIENGVNGIVCGNIDEVIRAIDTIGSIDNKKCREYAENRFSYIRMAKDYIKLIERVQRGETW